MQGVGTSRNPCSDIFHGQRPFSEREVLSVAKYLYSIRKRLIAYYDIHAYSQLWMTPWSYTRQYPSDYSEIVSILRDAGEGGTGERAPLLPFRGAMGSELPFRNCLYSILATIFQPENTIEGTLCSN